MNFVADMKRDMAWYCTPLLVNYDYNIYHNVTVR